MSFDMLRSLIADVIRPERFGKAVTLQRTVRGIYNELTGTTGANTVTQYPMTVTPPAPVKITLASSTLVQQGDLACSAPAQQFDGLGIQTPSAETDELIIDAKTWKVISASPVYLSSTVGMYELVLRQ